MQTERGGHARDTRITLKDVRARWRKAPGIANASALPGLREDPRS